MTTIDVFKKESDFRVCEAGTVIFTEGEQGDLMYAVIAGEVEILVLHHVVETVGPGGIFGEMALIDSGPRSAMARAKTTCKIVPVSKDRFMFLVQQTPYFSLQVMRIMSERLRRLDLVL
jgi:CRP/FNR family cyclic AMP-dependent transcriptional regulator